MKSDPEKAAEVKAQIAALSKELAALRKEVVLCNSIAERSGVIQEKIKAVREDEQPERKEKTDREPRLGALVFLCTIPVTQRSKSCGSAWRVRKLP